MTNGIEVGDKVRLNGDIGRVFGIDDWNDRYPADLWVAFEDGNETISLKTRVDLVEKLEKYL